MPSPALARVVLMAETRPERVTLLVPLVISVTPEAAVPTVRVPLLTLRVTVTLTSPSSSAVLRPVILSVASSLRVRAVATVLTGRSLTEVIVICAVSEEEEKAEPVVVSTLEPAEPVVASQALKVKASAMVPLKLAAGRKKRRAVPLSNRALEALTVPTVFQVEPESVENQRMPLAFTSVMAMPLGSPSTSVMPPVKEEMRLPAVPAGTAASSRTVLRVSAVSARTGASFTDVTPTFT